MRVIECDCKLRTDVTGGMETTLRPIGHIDRQKRMAQGGVDSHHTQSPPLDTVRKHAHRAGRAHRSKLQSCAADADGAADRADVAATSRLLSGLEAERALPGGCCAMDAKELKMADVEGVSAYAQLQALTSICALTAPPLHLLPHPPPPLHLSGVSRSRHGKPIAV